MASFGGSTMTLKRLKEICVKNDLYRTPSVNDKLYLHYEGFSEIDGAVLGEYTGLRCLWLQGNGLGKIQGLEKLVELRTLCLHENTIDELQGLDTLSKLENINLSKNFIQTLENLEGLVELQTLTLGHNSIGPEAAKMEHVVVLPKLQTLDLQANRLDDGEAVLDVVARIPTLRVLYLMGNPFVKTMRHYRKRFISACKDLRYLDDRPVFEDERRRSEAWAAVMETSGGDVDAALAAERDEIAKIREEKRHAEDKRHRDFQDLINRAREGAANTPAGPARGTTFSGDAIFDPDRRADDDDDDAATTAVPSSFVEIDELD